MTSNLVSKRMRIAILGVLPALLSLTGCGINGTSRVASTSPVVSAAAAKLQGRVFGGQQPISDATIQLYATGTGGYGSAATPLLFDSVFTDSNGNFSITGEYSCSSPSTQVYLTATGGNSGAGSLNTQIAAMAALGSCGNLTTSTYININELTTVAAVWALAPFMSSYAAVGTSPSNQIGLVNAFATAASLVNIATGTAPGIGPAGTTVPVSELNTLADILASCINTNGGIAGDTSPCGALFTAATPPTGAAPTDTIAAALNMAINPGRNVSTLLSLPTAQPPFQPTVNSATDLTVSIKYTPSGISTPSAMAVDASGNVWVANKTGGVTEVDPNGNRLAAYTSGISAPSAIAIDTSGRAWIANQGSNTLTVISGGAATNPTVSGLNSPSGIAIDSEGLLWVTNSGANSVVAVTTSGATVTGSSTYTGAGITSPVAVAINTH